MLQLDFHPTGRHFLQIPGPSPVPDRILRAMSLPTIDHRGPEFGALGLQVLAGIQQIFKTRHPVVIYPASGTGAWEAALANTLSPGDHVLMYETGHFASLWQKMATRLGLQTEFLACAGSDEQLPHAPGWRRGVQADLIEARLRADTGARRSRPCAWCTTRPRPASPPTSPRCARAIDAAGHPALLMVDTHLGPRQRRLPPRRMGRRRHHQRLAEGPDAAAGHQLQRALAAALEASEDARSCRARSGPGTRSSR